MRLAVKIGLLLTFGCGVAFADSDPIRERRDTMKAVGDVTKTVVGMLKGAPFDLEAVRAALKSYATIAATQPNLYPDNSKTGDTNALPGIWDNKTDFAARFTKFGDDANAASNAITDLASFQATIPNVLKNCAGCHELYLAKKN